MNKPYFVEIKQLLTKLATITTNFELYSNDITSDSHKSSTYLQSA